jgi:hypothetical protein
MASCAASRARKKLSLRSLGMKLVFLALRGGDQLLGPFNRELVVYRKQNLSISNNCLVDLDALLAHGSTFDHAASRPYFYYDCEDDWFQ